MTFAITLGSQHAGVTPAPVPAYEQRRPPRGLAVGRRDIDRHVSANFYPTPPEATRALLSVETFDGPIWEPACGKGHITKVLKAAGHEVLATDLNDWGYGISGIDFLDPQHISNARRLGPRVKHVVTNPPYGSGLADDFIERALELTSATDGKVAMLLNLSSLVLTRRTRFWRSRPPARLYAIDGIVCWPDPDRPPPAHFRDQRYVWVVWEPAAARPPLPPSFWWLSGSDFH